MLKIIYLFTISFLLTNSVVAQESLSKQEVADLTQLKNDMVGSYQFQMINTRSLPSVPLITFKTINELRDENEIVYHELSENCRIKILPKSTIKKQDFEYLDYYTFITINDK